MIVVSGKVPQAKRVDRKLHNIAIASQTGELVQTEAERRADVIAWKTNLLKQKNPPSVPVLDPMVVPRQYSEEELNALQILSRKVCPQKQFLPPINSLVEDPMSTTESIGQGIQRALELEGALAEKMKTQTQVESAGNEFSERPEKVVYKPLISIECNDSSFATPFTPMTYTLNSPELSPTGAKSAFELLVGLDQKNKPISPTERSAKLRRYKIGLSPMQKVKNMLDDIVDRINDESAARPAGPHRMPRRAQYAMSIPQLSDVAERVSQAAAAQKRKHVVCISGPNPNRARSPPRSKEILLTMTDDTGATATTSSRLDSDELNKIDRHDNDDCDDSASPETFFAGGDWEQQSAVESNYSISLTYDSPEQLVGGPSPDLHQPNGMFFASEIDSTSLFTDSGTLKDSALKGSIKLDPLSPVERREGGVEIGGRRGLHRKPVELNQRGDQPHAGAVSRRDNLDNGIKCSRCTLTGRLWCHGCKLAFCYTCWGLVDHHEALDGVKVMEDERQVFLTAPANAAGEDDDESAEQISTLAMKPIAPIVYSQPRVFKLSPKKSAAETKLAPSTLQFDEDNATHFAAERNDPERMRFLVNLKVKRLHETSQRMKNHILHLRSKAHQKNLIAEKRDEQVQQKLDHKQRMRMIEKQMALELEQASQASQGIHGVVLNKKSERQIAAEKRTNSPGVLGRSRNSSPNWRTHKITNPVERKRAEEQDQEEMMNDPIAGWGWSDMTAKAAKNKNYPELPFSDNLDLAWLVPTHMADQLEQFKSTKTHAPAPSSAQMRIAQKLSLW